jgi:HlyD family secretion protein
MNNCRCLIYCVLFVTILSCKLNNKHAILTCKAERMNFTDEITVSGSVEAINSDFIRCPQIFRSTILSLTDDGTMVKAGDTVCVLENKDLISRYERIQTSQEQRRAEFNKNKADLALKFALLEAGVKNNEAQTAISNLDSLQLKYASEVQQKIMALELKKAAIQKERFKNKLAALEKINDSELRKIELQIKRDDNQLTNIESDIKKLVLLSPQDGLFIRSNSMMGGGKVKEGDKIWPGMNIAEIPDLSSMRIKFQASESEFKRTSIGDSVLITFDALPGNFATGKVTFKAPIGQPKNNKSKVKYYDMLVSIDSCKALPGAGLSANCKIFVENLADTLVAPLISVFDEDSTKYIFVKNGKHFEKREVIVGEASPSNAIISAGINVGDILALSKPNEMEVKNTILLTADEKEKVKKLQALQQSKKAPQVNGAPPRSGTGGSHMIIIYN